MTGGSLACHRAWFHKQELARTGKQRATPTFGFANAGCMRIFKMYTMGCQIVKLCLRPGMFETDFVVAGKAPPNNSVCRSVDLSWMIDNGPGRGFGFVRSIAIAQHRLNDAMQLRSGQPRHFSQADRSGQSIRANGSEGEDTAHFGFGEGV